MEFKYFSINGEIKPMKEAAVSLANIEYQYGFGVYENVRVADGKPLFLSEHVERLQSSAKIVGLEHSPANATLEKNVADLVEKCGGGTFNLKILLVGGPDPFLAILPLNPLFPDKKLYRDGVDLITYEYQRPFPHAKSLNMLQSYLAYKKAKESGAYDALLVNNKGCVTEGTRTNFFYLRDKTIVSAPQNEILIGVTRAHVLEVAKKMGFAFEERDVRFGDIETSDGAFITSTSSKILLVREIDETRLPVRPQPLVELMEAFDEFLDAER